jgi:protein-tyrosine-phosphatase
MRTEGDGDEFDVVSAGSEETPLDPDAVSAMREVGIDISGQQPKAVNRYLGRRFSYVVSASALIGSNRCLTLPQAGQSQVQQTSELRSRSMCRDVLFDPIILAASS